MIKLYIIFLVTTWMPLLFFLVTRDKAAFGDSYYLVYIFLSTFSLGSFIAALSARDFEEDRKAKSQGRPSGTKREQRES